MYQFVPSLLSLLITTWTSTLWIPSALALNVIVAGPRGRSFENDVSVQAMNLTARQYLNVSNFYLVMQPDCTLEAYNGTVPFLKTNYSAQAPQGRSGEWDCYATMQADGNLVVYQRINATYSQPLWASWTYSYAYKNSTYRYLVLGRDGSLSMHEPDGPALIMHQPFVPVKASLPGATSPNTSSNPARLFPPELAWKPSISLDDYPYMPADYFLSQGSKLQTVDERFVLLLGHDCKLQSQELWAVNGTVKRVIWDPQRSMAGVGGGSCELKLRQDGLLVVSDKVSGGVYWNSSVRGDGSASSWVVKVNADDGHVSVSDILDGTKVLWTSSGALAARSVVVVWPTVVGVGGGVLVVAMVALLFWYIYLRPRFNDPGEKAFRKRLRATGGLSKELSQAKIKQATNSFGNKIGYGGFGDVFYGKLPDGQEIAAKVLTADSRQSNQEFHNEVELLSVVHHKYLVALLGYSSTWKQKVLIYEYMGGGDLRDRLQGKSAAKNPLNWKQRMRITLQIAKGDDHLVFQCSWFCEGLAYLHDKCSPAIIHRDVKSNNILLSDKRLVAKLADFGLSKQISADQTPATHITTAVKGTPGYLDPEYHETGMLTERSDVYAFGIVLMEILTGRDQMGIPQRVSEGRRLGQLDDLADPNLGGDFDRDEFVSLVELSLWCVTKSTLERPYMRDVVQKLQELDSEHVMKFGMDFVHSEVDSNGTEASFCNFPSSGISNFEVSGFVRDIKASV